MRRSDDDGVTWRDAVNVTSGLPFAYSCLTEVSRSAVAGELFAVPAQACEWSEMGWAGRGGARLSWCSGELDCHSTRWDGSPLCVAAVAALHLQCNGGFKWHRANNAAQSADPFALQ